LCLFFVNSYAVCLLLNPKLLNVSSVEGLSPARDFLGFISIFAKVSARAVAITYGSLIVFGTIHLLYQVSDLFNSYYSEFEKFEIGLSISIIGIGISFPIISFFIFTFVMLHVQIMESIISTIPHLKSIAILLRKANRD
jgi:hypothetical protein